MRTNLNKFWLSLSILCLFLVMGCGLTAYRTHPEFEARVKSIKEPVLIPPDVYMYELLPGGIVMLRDDWSANGRENLKIAILQGFERKQCHVKPLKMGAENAKEMTDVQALYRLVNKTMQRHTFGPRQSSDKAHGFKYSLGNIETILQKLGADSMIFVGGYDHVSNGSRRALIDLAVADSSGTILYYSVKGTKAGTDLRDPASAAVMIQDLISSFSEAGG